jgi:hypothetical protein
VFGYVIPPLQALPEEERERFRRVYCGLCHTLGRRCGAVTRLILNYDFTFLAILLSDGKERSCGAARCPASPWKKKCYQTQDAAMELAADESVILSYWQLRDGVADHGFFKGLKDRFLSFILRPAYQKAALARPDFDAGTRRQLQKLAELERTGCTSMDAAADTFAELLAAAADTVPDGARRRVLREMLYHLGRWVYLVDAADDLKADAASGGYNPLALRYNLKDGTMSAAVRAEFTATLDHSVHMIAAAFELWDFGCWTAVLKATIYSGLFQVGKAVLDGTFRTGFLGTKKEKIVEETA